MLNNSRHVKSHACPRCNGDLFTETMHNKTDEVCLQCGYRRQLGTDVFNPVKTHNKVTYPYHRRKRDYAL